MTFLILASAGTVTAAVAVKFAERIESWPPVRRALDVVLGVES